MARWPFERVLWTIERRLVWPLQERTGELSAPLRLGGGAALAVVAVAACTLGAVLATNGGTTSEPKLIQSAAPIAAQPQPEPAPEPAPVLRGAVPDFTPEAEGGGAKVSSGEAIAAEKTDSGAAGSTSASTSSTEGGAPVKPAARQVAHQFAGAFVLYETGKASTEVRSAFHKTATPQLARALLQRPPRLPANVKVPKAKVLNLVPGPSEAGVHSISVSLLRVGLTSELRLDMERDRKTGKWQVTDVLG